MRRGPSGPAGQPPAPDGPGGADRGAGPGSAGGSVLRLLGLAAAAALVALAALPPPAPVVPASEPTAAVTRRGEATVAVPRSPPPSDAATTAAPQGRQCAAPAGLTAFRAPPPHGGYNNQREHVVNLVLLAALWNLSAVVLPTSRPSDYAGPAGDPRRWPPPWRGLAQRADAPFGALWDEDHFRAALAAPPLGLCVLSPQQAATEAQFTVRGLTDLLAPGRSDRALRKSAATYRQIHGHTPADLRGRCCEGLRAPPRGKAAVVATEDPGQPCRPGQRCPPRTLCTVVYSRFRSHCDEFGPERCSAALGALRAAPAVRSLAAEVVEGVAAKAGGRWVSLHLRQWMCKVTPRQIEWLAKELAPHRDSALYVCSDMPPGHPLLAPLRALFRGGLVGKATFLGGREGDLPFEVRAAVDWEVLLAAPQHYAFDSDSSFTHFVDAYRRMSGRAGVGLLRRPEAIPPKQGCWGT